MQRHPQRTIAVIGVRPPPHHELHLPEALAARPRRVLGRQKIRTGHVGALPGQRKRDGAPDAASRASDESDPACKGDRTGDRVTSPYTTRASHDKTWPNSSSQPSSSISM